MTNGSLTETQTIASMPCARNAGASSLKRGRCVDEHVGVNAPGSEKTTTFLFAKMSSVVIVAQSPLRRTRNATSGTRDPSRETRCSAMSLLLAESWFERVHEHDDGGPMGIN